jgi:hypothetical protein
MKKLFLLFIILSLFSTIVEAQIKRNYFPIWTFHQRNANIYGISLGFASGLNETQNTVNNGVKIELIGLGLFAPMFPSSPIAKNDSLFQIEKTTKIIEKTNGISLSATGTMCNCTTNGITIGGIGQLHHKVNGISVAGMMNYAQISNGMQVALLWNESYETNGVQIGLVNESHKLFGFQFGLWNINQRRSSPLINWNFRRR